MALFSAIFICFPNSTHYPCCKAFYREHWVNIVILGPGAIGSLWAIKLKHAGHQVSLWSTSQSETALVQLDQNEPEVFDHRSTQSLSQADLLLVTVKAWQVETAITPLIPWLHSDTIITLMHNGMGTAEIVAQLIPKNPIILATTTHGAYKSTKSQVHHTGSGHTQLGGYNSLGKQCDFLAEVFQHALAPASWNQDIRQALWTKLAINCAINPLTGIHQFKNGQLTQEKWRTTLRDLTQELVEVMMLEHIDTNPKELLETILNVAQATSENYSSMRQDIAHQRQTEIDFITGYMLQQADKHHIEIPRNRDLYNRIKQIENSWKES